MEFGQEHLFGERVISSINFDEQQIIRDILFLHAPEKKIDLDPCFSIGNFYKNGITRPKYCFDKTPQCNGVLQATSDNLPIENESIYCVNFDPPFVIAGKDNYEQNKEVNLIQKRFTAFESWSELKSMYYNSMKEFYRILKNRGIVIFKCQDVISGGKQYFTHNFIIQKSIEIGFYPKDMFILLAKSRLIGNINKQQHARKFHCYFIVLKKEICPVNYESVFYLG